MYTVSHGAVGRMLLFNFILFNVVHILDVIFNMLVIQLILFPKCISVALYSL